MESDERSAMDKSKIARWSFPAVTGPSPSERWGHSVVHFGKKLFVFGGCCGRQHFSSVVALSLSLSLSPSPPSLAWGPLPSFGHLPGARDSHSATLIGQKMLIFGGTDGAKKVNDVHLLDLETLEWTRPEVSGQLPPARESHTAVYSARKKKLVVFGGSADGDGNYLNDFHVLCTETMTWSAPEPYGELPARRDSHTAVLVGEKMVVYGGDCGERYLGEVDMLDLDTYTWTKLETIGFSRPGVRAGHSAISVDNKVYIFGGVGDQAYYNDVWVLDIERAVWTQLETCGPTPQARFSHTATLCDSSVVIYGGCGADEHPLNELVILELPKKSQISAVDDLEPESANFTPIDGGPILGLIENDNSGEAQPPESMPDGRTDTELPTGTGTETETETKNGTVTERAVGTEPQTVPPSFHNLELEDANLEEAGGRGSTGGQEPFLYGWTNQAGLASVAEPPQAFLRSSTSPDRSPTRSVEGEPLPPSLKRGRSPGSGPPSYLEQLLGSDPEQPVRSTEQQQRQASPSSVDTPAKRRRGRPRKFDVSEFEGEQAEPSHSLSHSHSLSLSGHAPPSPPSASTPAKPLSHPPPTPTTKPAPPLPSPSPSAPLPSQQLAAFIQQQQANIQQRLQQKQQQLQLQLQLQQQQNMQHLQGGLQPLTTSSGGFRVQQPQSEQASRVAQSRIAHQAPSPPQHPQTPHLHPPQMHDNAGGSRESEKGPQRSNDNNNNNNNNTNSSNNNSSNGNNNNNNSSKSGGPTRVEVSRIIMGPQLPIGTELRCMVDGVFDAGYTLSAIVNGQNLRGVLFTPVTSPSPTQPVIAIPVQRDGKPLMGRSMDPSSMYTTGTPVTMQLAQNAALPQSGEWFRQGSDSGIKQTSSRGGGGGGGGALPLANEHSIKQNSPLGPIYGVPRGFSNMAVTPNTAAEMARLITDLQTAQASYPSATLNPSLKRGHSQPQSSSSGGEREKERERGREREAIKQETSSTTTSKGGGCWLWQPVNGSAGGPPTSSPSPSPNNSSLPLPSPSLSSPSMTTHHALHRDGHVQYIAVPSMAPNNGIPQMFATDSHGNIVGRARGLAVYQGPYTHPSHGGPNYGGGGLAHGNPLGPNGTAVQGAATQFSNGSTEMAAWNREAHVHRQ